MDCTVCFSICTVNTSYLKTRRYRPARIKIDKKCPGYMYLSTSLEVSVVYRKVTSSIDRRGILLCISSRPTNGSYMLSLSPVILLLCPLFLFLSFRPILASFLSSCYSISSTSPSFLRHYGNTLNPPHRPIKLG